jgi:hypothetical protein
MHSLKCCLREHALVVGFDSGAVEVSVLMGYGTASLGNWCPTFQRQYNCMIIRGRMSSEVIRPWKMRPPRCLETSGIDHPVMLCHILEERRSHGCTIRSRMLFLTILHTKYQTLALNSGPRDWSCFQQRAI